MSLLSYGDCFSVQPEGDVMKVLAREISMVTLLAACCSGLTGHTGLFSCPSAFPFGLTEWQERFFAPVSLKSVECFEISEELKTYNWVFPF